MECNHYVHDPFSIAIELHVGILSRNHTPTDGIGGTHQPAFSIKKLFTVRYFNSAVRPSHMMDLSGRGALCPFEKSISDGHGVSKVVLRETPMKKIERSPIFSRILLENEPLYILT